MSRDFNSNAATGLQWREGRKKIRPLVITVVERACTPVHLGGLDSLGETQGRVLRLSLIFKIRVCRGHTSY